MKKLVTLLVVLFTSIGFSQTLTTPTSQNIPIGVSGLGISGFSLSGYNATTIYKASLSITGNANASFTIGTTTGLTRDYGFNSWTNITAVNFTGIPANIENALNSIKFNTTSTVDGLINLSVVITSQVTGMYYNPTNGHMYKSVASSIDYATAKSLASQFTFDGVQGYLVTITSQDEQNFIVQKTSQNNIWIALEDTAVEGYWRISAGPENGTLIKTSNGQTNGNISGQYNNWCGGEPNNAGNEDAAVTKWGGGGCWNDLPASGYNGGGYVIEYGDWTDPTQSTFNSTQQTQITFTQKEMLWVDYEFDFGSNINPTDFSGKMHYEESANSWATNNTTNLILNSSGKVNVTNQIQETTLGKKATTIGGNVEWCVIYNRDITNNRYRVGIDKREFPSGFDFTKLTRLQLFDLYDGVAEYKTHDAYWVEYYIPATSNLDWDGSSYGAYLRNGGSYQALRAEFSFEDVLGYKPQSFIFNSPSQTDIETLIDDVVTVTDVVLAFNELSGGGLNGGTAGNLNGIQLGNADINGDNNFDFNDTYKLLDYLNGGSLVQSTNTLVYFMKVKTKTDWDATTTSNWTSKYNGTTLMADVDVDENNLIQFPKYKVTWLGDVNLSHSPTSTGAVTSKSASMKSTSKESIADAYIETELIDGKVIATIEVTSSELAGIQFRLNYSDKLQYNSFQSTSSDVNFESDRGSFLSLGSLSTKQTVLEQKIKYTIEFTDNMGLNSTLGLITVKGVDAVDVYDNPVKIRIL